jgi:shikimate kinase|tara:strand:- start:175 stop:666 length:492 start_codon:yes stop_codon:yes gene_type:complete
MGSGKTMVGRSLSKSINYNFYDLDKFIELNEKKSISEIFTHKNEVYFREIESKYLNQLISIKEKKIISTGGGTPCYSNNIDLINNNSVSIYLKASVDTLVKRLKDAQINRPLISHLKDTNELKDFISKHLFERNYFYEKAKIKIKTDDLKLREIINLIIGSLA